MRTIAAVALGCFMLAWGVGAHAEPNVTSYSLAPDGSTLALLEPDQQALEIRSAKVSRTLSLAGAGQGAFAPAHVISWSADSRFVALQFRADEETTVAMLVDVSTMKIVWSRSVESVDWVGSDHHLLVVPTYPIDGTQVNAGLVLVDAGSLEEQVLAGDHYFVGQIEGGDSVAIARAVSYEEGQPVYSIVRVDLAQGGKVTPEFDE